MKYHCVVNAFAHAMKLSPQQLANMLPHDGHLLLPEGEGQRSHHIQEIVDVAKDLGVWFAPIELVPVAYYPQHKRNYPVWFGGDMYNNFHRFKEYLQDSTGVIAGMQKGIGHAVYWDGTQCMDSTGKFDVWNEDHPFEPGTYWRAVWVT